MNESINYQNQRIYIIRPDIKTNDEQTKLHII